MRIRKKIEELRMKKEAEHLLKELEKYPELKDLQPPADLKERVYAEIERREKKLKESLSEEQQELIRMGIRYKNQQKSRKFIAVAVMVILLLSIGMTSLGGAEKVFYRISSMFMNRSRVVVDSDYVKVIGDTREEETYAQIEELLGFGPVRLGYIPQGTCFEEVSFFENMTTVQLIYGKESETTIVYWIKMNSSENSFARDYEDELIKEVQLFKEDIVIDIKEFRVENAETRWLVDFENAGTYYSIYILNMSEKEVRTIVDNLFFY